ncbi:MAG: pilus assembly protein, partial [Rhodocyclaceae bacterium]|nr:pilus assembly protein [Rhodocyclaceae bacterium]
AKKDVVKAKAAESTEKKAPSEGEREVHRGDTLAKIAAETKPEGVSLDQMLVALFRGNQEAFDGSNMNRLKAGKILSIPSKESVSAVDVGEARKTVVAQAADFNAYRKKLAASVAATPPAKDESPKQAAAGKITPKVEEKTPAPVPGKDKLEVSKTESPKGGKDAAKTQGRLSALEEDLVARDKALKEANSRVAELEKNLADLKKLAELKSQAGADMQKQAQAAKPAPADAKKPEPAPAQAVKPAEAPKPAETVKAPEPAKPADAAKPAEPPKTTEAPKATEPPKAEAPAGETPPPQPPVPKKKPLPPPPPEPEPDFMEENGLLVLGGGGVLALILGYLGISVMRKRRKATSGDSPSQITEGDLSANSVFGTTGGQSVDTSNVSLQTDFSQSGIGAIDTDEGVDPVAEADVYMAYGRDAQAEEILLDALKTDPTRHAIHRKLLEIYAGRKSLKQFEALATDLYGQTGGSGNDWEEAAKLGRSIDPENGLYGGAKAAAEEPVVDLSSTTLILPAEKVPPHDTVTMPGELAQMAAAAEMGAPPIDLGAPEPVKEDVAALDFDLDLGSSEPAPAVAAPSAAPVAHAEVSSLDFDLDLGSSEPAPSVEMSAAAEVPALDMDISLDSEPVAAAPAADIDFSLELPSATPAASEPAAAPPASVDFNFDLGDTALPEVAVQTAAEPAPAALDLSAISLDLGEPMAAEAPAAAVSEGVEIPAADSSEVNTKLELAQAYEEMGDKEGARELLQEVLQEGSAAQKEAARAKLAALG